MSQNSSRQDLVAAAVEIALRFGLEVQRSALHGERVWGAPRQIDVLCYHPQTHERVGLECRFDAGDGMEAERVLTLAVDINTWAMKGLVVIDGPGFSPYMGILRSRGPFIQLRDLERCLPLYFDGTLPVKPVRSESGTPTPRRALRRPS